jgi:hypothetical protein
MWGVGNVSQEGYVDGIVQNMLKRTDVAQSTPAGLTYIISLLHAVFYEIEIVLY